MSALPNRDQSIDAKTEADQRAAVVRIAHEWVGTKYQHGARIKGECCDCTFVAKVYEEAGLVGKVPIAPYVSNAHLHRASSQYLLHVKKYAHEVDRERAQPGDLVMFHVARDFSHAGIIIEPGWPEIIHADMAAGGVIPGRGDAGELARARSLKFFTLW